MSLRARAVAHLWTDDKAPWEYVKLVLCRDVFHCTPSELERENFKDVAIALTLVNAEGYVERLRGGKGARLPADSDGSWT